MFWKKTFSGILVLLVLLPSSFLVDLNLNYRGNTQVTSLIQNSDYDIEFSTSTSSDFNYSMLVNLESSGFGDELESVIESALECVGLAFVYFYSESCYFCNLEKPIISELETEYAERVVFIRVDGTKALKSTLKTIHCTSQILSN